MGKPKLYYGLKDFTLIAKERGLDLNTRALSVYKSRGALPEPKVIVGTGRNAKSGWTKQQIENWINEKLITDEKK